MSDFYEIDFIKIEQSGNADAIAMRYKKNGVTTIHIVDAGYSDTGKSMVDHIKRYFNNPTYLDHVVLTHPDQDHIGGMTHILENFKIGTLWMNCPWDHMDEIFEYAPNFRNIDNLEKRLKECYSKLYELEVLAKKKRIKIKKPFQGQIIGEFTVMSPSKDFYINMVVSSKKSKGLEHPEVSIEDSHHFLKKIIESAKEFFTRPWGYELFSSEQTDPENETSVVQFATLCGSKILLTGDAGKEALAEVIKYDENTTHHFPGVNFFQIPHHGSRKNINEDVLNKILGPKLSAVENKFTAVASISSVTAEQKDYPRRMVIRAMNHRGGSVYTNINGCLSHHSKYAPSRNGFSPSTPMDYPHEVEE